MLVRTCMRRKSPRLTIEFTVEERPFLEKQAATRTAPYCQFQRVKAILPAADDYRNVEIAAKTDQDPRTVSILRKEFLGPKVRCAVRESANGASTLFFPLRPELQRFI